MHSDNAFGRALDTTPDVWARQVASWRAMSPARKAEIVATLTQTTMQLAEAGIRSRHPQASEREVFLRLAILLHGRDLAARIDPAAALLSP